MTITLPSTLDDTTDFALDEVADLHGHLAALRERAPAAWVNIFGRPGVMFTSYDLVNAAFKDEETFPSRAFYSNVVTDVLGYNIQCMYGQEHRRNRALASPTFRQRLVQDLVTPVLEPVANELVDRFEADGEADLVKQFTTRYPFKIILRMLGLPQAAEEDVTRWALGMLDIQLNYENAVRCSQEFTAFVDPILQERRTDPADDLISKLATEEIDGDRLTDDEIMNFLKLLFPAGADTTYLGLGNTLYGLLTNPEQLEARARRSRGRSALGRRGRRAVERAGRDAAAPLPRGSRVERHPDPGGHPVDLRDRRRQPRSRDVRRSQHLRRGAPPEHHHDVRLRPALLPRRAPRACGDGRVTPGAAEPSPEDAPRRRRRRADQGLGRADPPRPEPTARSGSTETASCSCAL